jgi:hypothetical protein
MPTVELTEEERRLLISVLMVEIQSSKYPLSPRIVMLKRIRAKLRGETPAPQQPPRVRAGVPSC